MYIYWRDNKKCQTSVESTKPITAQPIATKVTTELSPIKSLLKYWNKRGCGGKISRKTRENVSNIGDYPSPLIMHWSLTVRCDFQLHFKFDLNQRRQPDCAEGTESSVVFRSQVRSWSWHNGRDTEFEFKGEQQFLVESKQQNIVHRWNNPLTVCWSKILSLA